MKRILKLTLLLILSVIIFVIYCNLIMIAGAKGKITDSVDELPEVKVGILLGTSKYFIGGHTNFYYEQRVEAARDALEKGKIEYILVSGDNGSDDYNEPATIKKSLLDLGVLEEKIILDYAGFRTLDSMVRAKEVFGQKEVTVISQKFHNRRAVYIGEKKGLKVYGLNAEQGIKNPHTKTNNREHLARVKAWLDVNILNTKAKYLGEPIEIPPKNPQE